jgi:hypothetical protein
MAKIARIIDPQHPQKDHWALIVRTGHIESRVKVIDGTTTPTDPRGDKLANASMGNLFEVSSWELVHNQNNTEQFRQFPVSAYGPITRGPTGQLNYNFNAHDIANPTADAVPVQPTANPAQGAPVPTPQPTATPAPAPPPAATTTRRKKKKKGEDTVKKDGAPTVSMSMIPMLIHATPITDAFMILGPPGVGKSEGVHDYARSNNLRVFDIRLSQINPVDIRGIGVPDLENNLCRWLPADFLPTEPNSLIFLDEINDAPPSVKSAAYQLVLDRRAGNYTVPTDCRIIAAGNRQGDQGMATKMPRPLANRFNHVEVEADISSWRTWALNHNIDPRLIAFLSSREELLLDMSPDNAGGPWPSPRSWTRASRMLQSGLPPEHLKTAVAACVGILAAGQLFKFLDNQRGLPDPADILARDGVQPPTRLAISRATNLVSGIAAHCQNDDTQIERAIRYAHKLSEEFGVLLVRMLEEKFSTARVLVIPGYQEFCDTVLQRYLQKHTELEAQDVGAEDVEAE